MIPFNQEFLIFFWKKVKKKKYTKMKQIFFFFFSPFVDRKKFFSLKKIYIYKI